MTDAHAPEDGAQAAHLDRLTAALAVEPCSPTCPNWLRYGIAPKNAHHGQRPGSCRSKAHRREHLGYAGRRILVSRKWSGKTLADHKQDRRAWVMTTLGIDDTPTEEPTGRVPAKIRAPRLPQNATTSPGAWQAATTPSGHEHTVSWSPSPNAANGAPPSTLPQTANPHRHKIFRQLTPTERERRHERRKALQPGGGRGTVWYRGPVPPSPGG